MNKKVIKNKIKSTSNIRKITRTMEMVSVAKMKKAVSLADGYKTFGIEARDMMSILAAQREKHSLTISNNSEKVLFIVIAGQKGLCGSYNTNIYKKLARDYKQIDNLNKRFICIGKYAEKIARRFDRKENGESMGNIVNSFLDKEFNIAHASTIVDYIINEYNKSSYSKVELIYTDFTSINSQTVESIQLLPFDIKNNSSNNFSEKDIFDYTFEPNVETVFNYVARIILQNVILGSLNRARAAEHAARMLAMKTASDNAGEMISELKLWYNKARQAAITQEIAEISSGAMAMGKREE